MFNSPFASTSKPALSADSSIVFVSDNYVEDYVGGAELTTQALIDACPFEFDKVKSADVDVSMLESGHNKYWIFGNFSNLNQELLPTIVANMNYSVLEYDYKYCKYRSPEKHEMAEQSPCDCHEDMHGKMISAFYYGAKSLWWMSEKQEEKYHSIFPFLSEKESIVLSSVFDDKFFINLKMLREKHANTEKSKYVVLGSPSWIKGRQEAISYCEENNLEYEELWGLSYDIVLEKLAMAKGFVYLPAGGDTCPRMVIEAKLLGCELVLNDNVQHKDELWFDTDDKFDTEAYLFAARDRFWNSIKQSMYWKPSVGGYTTTKDCESQGYPWKQCIQSMLGFCDEVVVVDGGSTDGTWEELQRLSAESDGKLKVDQVVRDWNHPRHAVYDGMQKAEARKRCDSEFLWQMDADEVVHEEDYNKIAELCKNFPNAAELMSLPVIEYWGGPSKVRCDINPWKWRLSKNSDHITHGIPVELRRHDDDGHLYSLPGSDGCDYVHTETHERIPHATFYTAEVDAVKRAALSGDTTAFSNYEKWFDSLVTMLPGVHHYSWFDIERKIKTYKNYWQRHWESLYNIKQEDVAENNMFFQKKWSDVTESDISDMSKKLAENMGGWVFHVPVDFNRPTPHVKISRDQPKVMLDEDEV